MIIDLTQPSFDVKHIKNVHIPMSDGVRIATDLFIPIGEGRFPAVFEFLPYRKDDRTADRWNAHYYFAERGFVGVRADIRGTGGSEGVALDEYTPQEQQDACEIIAWLATQDWCNGNVGMFGTSYGCFNTIQTAMHNPPALKDIACASPSPALIGQLFGLRRRRLSTRCIGVGCVPRMSFSR